MAEFDPPRSAKRVRQACTNCRRKKIRCPGDRPSCSYCTRLQQACNYGSDPQRDTSSIFKQSSSVDSINAHTDPEVLSRAERILTPGTEDNVLSRLFQIESRLSDLSRNIQPNSIESPAISSAQNHQHAIFDPSMPIDANFYQSDQNSASPNESDRAILDQIPKATFDGLINDYFQYSHNQPYSFFHESTFRTRLLNGALPDFLITVVIMTSLRFCNDRYFDNDLFSMNKRKITADYLARSCWKHLSTHYVDGEDECTVAVVQAVTLLAIYEFVEGRQRTAWVKIGIAAKFAQDLRLMFEPSPELPLCEQEEHRRAFWSIYLLDRLMTCGRARPPVFDDSTISLQLPCSELAFRTGIWEQSEELNVYTSNRSLQCIQPSPFSRVIIISALLSQCSRYAIQSESDNYGLPPWDKNSEYTAISSSLLYLESHVDWTQPSPDTPHAVLENERLDLNTFEHVIVSQILHHLCYCILNHYFLLRRRLNLISTRIPVSFSINSLYINLYHAQELNRVMKTALQTGYKVISSFLSYACLISATIHAVYRHSDTESVRERAAKDLDFNLTFLQRQAQYWPNAVTILHRLSDFCQYSQAYKDLISLAPEVNISTEDATRLYTLLDYSVLSTGRDTVVWPAASPTKILLLD